MSLPRKMGRMISAFLGEAATSLSLVSVSIIKASLYPVSIPL